VFVCTCVPGVSSGVFVCTCVPGVSSGVFVCTCVSGVSSGVPASAVERRLGRACHSVHVYFTPVSFPASTGESSPLPYVFHTCIIATIHR